MRGSWVVSLFRRKKKTRTRKYLDFFFLLDIPQAFHNISDLNQALTMSSALIFLPSSVTKISPEAGFVLKGYVLYKGCCRAAEISPSSQHQEGMLLSVNYVLCFWLILYI